MNKPNNIPNLLEELSQKLASKKFDLKLVRALLKKIKKCENGKCEEAKELTYEDKEFAYILYLETGKLEKIAKEKE